MPRPVPPHETDTAWKSVFWLLATLILLLTLWYAWQIREMQVLILGLTLACACLVIGARPWRTASDRGGVGLWTVGAVLFFVAVLYDFSLAPTLVAGAGAGFILGLAAARSVF